MNNIFQTPWFRLFKSHATKKSYKRGAIVCVQGEPFDKVGLVLSGKAVAYSYSINGRETWIGEYNQGRFIGLRALLANRATSFEIRSAQNLDVLMISHLKMMELMQEHQDLCKAMAIDLSERLNKSINDIVEVHSLSVKGRICAELLRRALPIGIDPDRQIIRPSPVFIELARRLNSSRETVSRTVSELQNKGILSREPGALIVEDPERLQDAIEFI